MNTLFLFQEEQSTFEALSPALREGWEVETETATYEDSAEKQIMRLSILRLHDPTLKELRQKAQNANSAEEIATLLQDFDLKDVDEDDLAELFFAMGPTVLSQLISSLLASAKTDDDVEGITALTTIRHSVLHALIPSSSHA